MQWGCKSTIKCVLPQNKDVSACTRGNYTEHYMLPQFIIQTQSASIVERNGFFALIMAPLVLLQKLINKQKTG